VSWGTYADAMCFEGQLHCNAHANNMVVLAPTPAAAAAAAGTDADGVSELFLSFLDLDMAFGSEDYLDTCGEVCVEGGASDGDGAVTAATVAAAAVVAAAAAVLVVVVVVVVVVRSVRHERSVL
jgi:hypothetical protein